MATKKSGLRTFLYLKKEDAEAAPRLRESQLMIHSLCEGIEKKARASKEYDRVVWEECFLLLIQRGRRYDARLKAVDEAGRRAQGDERVRANAELAKIISSNSYTVSPLWVRHIMVDQNGREVSEADISRMMVENGGEVEMRREQRIESTLESSLRIILELFKLRKSELVKGRQKDYVARLVKVGCLKAKTANGFWTELARIEQSFVTEATQKNSYSREREDRRWNAEQAAINTAVVQEEKLFRLEVEKKEKEAVELEQAAKAAITAAAAEKGPVAGGSASS